MDYNLGALDAEAFFQALKKLIAQMEEEERRAAREGLTEEELTIFDLLTRPQPILSKAQEAEVKRVARALLEKLQDLRVAYWRQNQQTRAAVQSEIRFKLNERPEDETCARKACGAALCCAGRGLPSRGAGGRRVAASLLTRAGD